MAQDNFGSKMRDKFANALGKNFPGVAKSVSASSLKKMSSEERLQFLMTIPEFQELYVTVQGLEEKVNAFTLGFSHLQARYMGDPGELSDWLKKQSTAAKKKTEKAEQVLTRRQMEQIGVEYARTLVIENPHQLLAGELQKRQAAAKKNKK